MAKKSTDKKRLILLDSHAIIHRAYHALPDFATSKGEPTGALYGLAAMLIKIFGELNPDYVVACFDLPGPTHRHEVYDAYKAGRVKTDDNLVFQLEKAKELFNAWGIPIYSHPGFEADDVIGTVVHNLIKDKETEIIIASGDMDTLQLVDGKKVQVYTLKKGINDTILYDEKAVLDRFGFKPELLPDYKGLRGDPSDNIIGITGIGEKTATTLICQFGTIENIYKTLKKEPEKVKRSGITDRIMNLLVEGEEEALFSKTLATIRTDAPINFTLPKNWKETLDIDRLVQFFTELEFRTMGERVKMLLNKEDKGKNDAVSKEKLKPILDPDSEESKELCLMLWVADSNLTNPTLDDVFNFTKTEDLTEARKILETELKKREVESVYKKIEKPLIEVTDKMNVRGIKVDRDLLKDLSRRYHVELSRIEKEIWKEAGEEFNINSPKILSKILFEKLELGGKRQKKTPTGALSTKESELVKLKDDHIIIAKILEYRELQKLLSTYIDAMPPLLDENSRLHSTFVQSGSTTGRLASTNPNLQNIPIKTELGRVIRNAFVAEEGFKLLSIDYSQIELRIAAILSEDKKLIEIFKNGEDVHSGVASRVFKVPADKVDKAMRIKAKTINFGVLFGMGVNALKVNLGTDRKEAQEFYNEYFQTFTELAAYLDKVKSETERRGYTETMFGRRRYFSGFKSHLPFIKAQAERMAINAPIQGTEADIVKLSMIRVNEYIKKRGWEKDVYTLLNVHDEIVYEVKEELAEEAAKEFKKIMEEIIPDKDRKGVPIVAEAAIGDNWGVMESL